MLHLISLTLILGLAFYVAFGVASVNRVVINKPSTVFCVSPTSFVFM